MRFGFLGSGQGGPPARGIVLVVGSATAFGFIPVFATWAYQSGLNVTTLLTLRFVVASAVFFVFFAIRRSLRFPARREMLRLLLLGGVLYAGQSLCYFSAVQYMSPAAAVLLFYLYPAFVTGFSLAASRSRYVAAALGPTVVSLIGVMLVVGAAGQRINVAGAAFAVGAALFYTVYVVLGSRMSATSSPLVVTAWVTFFASLSFLTVSVVTDSLDLSFPSEGWVPVGGVALVSTVLSITAFFAGAALLGAARASILSMLEPVVAVVATWMFLGETLTLLQVAGGAITIVGSVWATSVLNRAFSAKEASRSDRSLSLTGQ